MYKFVEINKEYVPLHGKVFPEMQTIERTIILNNDSDKYEHIVRMDTLLGIERNDYTYLIPVAIKSHERNDIDKFPKELTEDLENKLNTICKRYKKECIIDESIECNFDYVGTIKIYKYKKDV